MKPIIEFFCVFLVIAFCSKFSEVEFYDLILGYALFMTIWIRQKLDKAGL